MVFICVFLVTSCFPEHKPRWAEGGTQLKGSVVRTAALSLGLITLAASQNPWLRSAGDPEQLQVRGAQTGRCPLDFQLLDEDLGKSGEALSGFKAGDFQPSLL